MSISRKYYIYQGPLNQLRHNFDAVGFRKLGKLNSLKIRDKTLDICPCSHYDKPKVKLFTRADYLPDNSQ
ncbi:hypothetical protein NECAME_04322 [Necator americanus]|uniref:Uncharacterized protein n=1 Tax=Necator americanus TaxID=51031 RepID=W2SUB7_NECAM|nr:hypothetical protein NECAME_04322 [Necator americanus]ETN73324.1 hypothetical protein NECAME_04322 [Necator americanus]